MNIKPVELKEKLNINSLSTLNTYLSRPEFNHIKKVRNTKKEVILTNVQEQDIDLIKLFLGRKSMNAKQKAIVSSKIQEIHKQMELNKTSQYRI